MLLSTKGAIHWQPGATPQDLWSTKSAALKARFTSGDSPSGMFGIEEPSVEFESRFQRSIIWAISIPWGGAPGCK